jgi:tungstate transport system ATP-binding protein
METILTVKDIQKSYAGKTVLDISTLELGKGRITALVGPSGSGKSTFLKIINGIEEPCSGEMIFDGEAVPFGKSLSIETRRKMILVFQKSVLFNTTVFENIAYGLKIRGVDKRIISDKVMNILELTGLDGKAHRRAATLSGGEAQRVAVARALVMEPRLLLLDEPTSDLDPSNVAMIEKLIRHARDSVHASVIVVTHNMYQAKRLADHIVFVMDGRVVEAGPPEKLFSDPDNGLTRDFINGEMVC